MPNNRIHVTVTPNPPNGNDFPISAAGTAPYVQQNGDIELALDEAYDITFELAPAHGVTNWRSNSPFGNDTGSCPGPGQGPSGPFSLNAGGNATSITIHVDAQSDACEFQYRLNYNGSYFSDPIIVIGSSTR